MKQGSYFIAIYSLGYFIYTSVHMAYQVERERDILNQSRYDPQIKEAMISMGITPTTMALNMILADCSTIGIFLTIVLIIGLWKSSKYLLLPWCFINLLTITVELLCIVYLVYEAYTNSSHDVANDLKPIVPWVPPMLRRHNVTGNWKVAPPKMGNNSLLVLFFLLDMALIVINCIILRCIVWQFNEFHQGRGLRRRPRSPPMMQCTNPLAVTSSSADSSTDLSSGLSMISLFDLDIDSVPPLPYTLRPCSRCEVERETTV